jgi:TolA-binding protein
MKSKWILAALLALLIASPNLWAEEEATSAASADSTAPAGTEEDEEWLNSVWTQVDDMVKTQELKLQETVTVAGVRGAEAEDGILDKLYYKGAKRYPSQDKLKKAIDTLKQGIAKNPTDKDAPKQKFFIAQCYEKLGQMVQAKEYYGLVTKEHAKTSWAEKATKRLGELASAK